MKGKRRIFSAVLAVVLAVGLFAPMPASAATLYFTGLNDNVSFLRSSTMPCWSGGVLYVPYTVFDANLNDNHINLGLYTSYNRSSNVVTLFNLRQILVFDLNDGTCRDDMSGTTYDSRAIMRNGRPYLSLSMVCSFFNLEYSYIKLPYISQGYMVRIKSSDAVLPDDRYIDAAQWLINNRLRDYTQSLNPAAVTTPNASVTDPPGTDPGNNGGDVPSVNPGTTNPTNPIVIQEPNETQTAAYLAFCCESATEIDRILGILESDRRCGVFFLTPQLLEEEGDLVRRILGTGHSVGILPEGEEISAQLARGNLALERAAHTRTTLAYVSAGQRAGLEDSGWVCWKETLLLEPSSTVGAASFASSAVNRLGARRRTAYLTLTGSEDTARILPALLRQLNSSDYIVSVPIETRL